jgi:chromosomal replication initiator protein
MLANTGLGKTHLSQAVGHAVLTNNPNSRVYYMTAEDFANEMIHSLKTNRIEEFKNKYRKGCDILLLEEIQFLSGKRKTQDELGYTIDALANNEKKVIFTSSLPPKDIPHISKQLSSRFTSGLVTTIDDPDHDTRVKILRKKAEDHELGLTEEVIQYLAGFLKKDIRHMESALKCLKANSELMDVKIDLDLASDVINCLVTEPKSIKSEDIKDLVCKYYKVEPDILRSKSRKKEHAYPRNIFVYLCRQNTDETLERIANRINRSHSTVLYASELVHHKIKSDVKMRNQVEFLSKKIQELKS